MLFETWVAFIAASSIMLLIPGPTILTVISYASRIPRNNSKASIVILVAAVCLGDLSLIALSIIGLSTIIAASSAAYSLIKVIGGLYLLYLGLGMLKSAFNKQKDYAPANFNPKAKEAHTAKHIALKKHKMFLSTYLVTVLNPKGILFFGAFLPQFVNPNSNLNTQLLILSITFACLAAINTLVYSLSARTASTLVKSSRIKTFSEYIAATSLIGASLFTLTSKNT